jgi:hypothetical protein
MRNLWVAPLEVTNADGTAVANDTTETILAPNVAIPAGFMRDARALRITAAGKLSTTGTPTMTFAIRWGGVGGTLLATTEAITNGSGVSNVNWWLEALIFTRTNGSSGALLCMGKLHLHTAAGTVAHNVFGVSGYDAPANVSVDLTAAADLALTADWSAADPANTITCMMRLVETIN